MLNSLQQAKGAAGNLMKVNALVASQNSKQVNRQLMRNTNNIYYHTSDNEDKHRNSDHKAEASGYQSQQQSKPQLPKNANITGNLKAKPDQIDSYFVGKIQKAENRPKMIKLTQDQIKRSKRADKLSLVLQQ
jgi:predicted nucleotide-binding protein (sugar kinase/HSP70/actin superfamily)